MQRKRIAALCVFIAVFLSLCIAPFFSFSRNLQTNSNIWLTLSGRRSLTIPDAGSAAYTFGGLVMDTSGNELAAFTRQVSVLLPLPQGVTFLQDSCTLVVTDSAAAGDVVTFTLSGPPPYEDAAEATVAVTLTKNMLANPGFGDYPYLSGWSQNGEGGPFLESDGEGGYFVSLSARTAGDEGYWGTLVTDQTVFLEAGRLYVFRARVRTDGEYETLGATPGAGVEEGGSVTFSISRITGSEWIDVHAAFRPQSTGAYTPRFVFNAASPRTVYVDDLSLAAEEPAPTSVDLSAPKNIAIPKGETVQIPISAVVSDQEHNAVLGEAVGLYVSPENQGVWADAQTMTINVSPQAIGGTYTLMAQAEGYASLSAYHTFYVSLYSLADQAFERDGPGVSWGAMGDAKVAVADQFGQVSSPDGSRFGRFAMNGTAAIFYNNAYVFLQAGQSYVFELQLKKRAPDALTSLSIFISGIYSQSFEDSVLAAYTEVFADWQTVRLVFTPVQTVIGRPLFCFATDGGFDAQEVYIDNVRLQDAYVSARDVAISGKPVVGQTLKYSYRFINNFDSQDQSLVYWMVADQKDGPYKNLGVANQPELDLIETMTGKYIKVSVTPISLSSGLIGETVYSKPVFVLPKGAPPDAGEDGWAEPAPTAFPTPTSEAPQQSLPPDRAPDKEDGFWAVPLPEGYDILYFTDLLGRWSQRDVAVLRAAGVVNGTSPHVFSPDQTVTKAQFCAMLMRAFSLSPPPVSAGFSDVTAGAWYESAVNAAFSASLVPPVSDDLFGPNDLLTRQEVAFLCMNAFQKAGKTADGAPALTFSDADEVSGYARSAVQKACYLGLFQGDNENRLMPSRLVSREEAAAVMHRLMRLMQK